MGAPSAGGRSRTPRDLRPGHRPRSGWPPAFQIVTTRALSETLPDSFVIFDAGTVLLAPVGANTPMPLAVKTLELVLGGKPCRLPPPSVGRWPLDSTFDPVGVLVAHFDGTALHAPSPASADLTLGPAHVRVLARRAGTRLDSLPADEFRATVQLADLGLLTERQPERTDPADGGLPTASDPNPDLDQQGQVGLAPASSASADEDERVRVFAVFGSSGGDPSLALGMLTAFARRDRDGALDQMYDLRRPITDPAPMLQELAMRPAASVVLFADYSWTTEANLATSRAVHQLSPGSITVHGGPHVPRFPHERDAFLAAHPELDVVVRLEGELAVAEILTKLAGTIDQESLGSLAGIQGTTVRTPAGVVHAPDRPRLADLDLLPSPYLTGEYDHVDPAGWSIATIETDRGCPFRCTFCDWGSATGTKPRNFDDGRVRDEIEWIGAHGIPMLFIADANFGGTERDLGIARWIADVRARHGAPQTVIASFAKNTTEHIVSIVDCWRQAGIAADGLTAIQTTDRVTLQNVRRLNIGIQAHDTLTETFRERGLPLLTDLLIGLPGATVESFKIDLQRCIDLEVTPRIAEVEVLPNSPMNEPKYRREMEIQVGPKKTIMSTYSANSADVDEMLRLRLLFRALEHYGLLRHVLRYVQHEHGVRAVDLIHDIDRAIVTEPEEWPALTWVGRYFDLYSVPPADWMSWTDEVSAFLDTRHGIKRSPGLDTVLQVQRAVLPYYGRHFPDPVELPHDYSAWHQRLPRPGVESSTFSPLESYGPGLLVVTDPGRICATAIGRNNFVTRRDQVAENLFWMVNHWELASAVGRPLAATAGYTDGSSA